ncbi:spore coat protein YsxE [Rossellomorea aquimaris]|uniref:spore coat protein YsxE n=1 Tax=Rossellomorea aquimaris TaxID=189382 RepID=UPI0007D06AFD|nr:spore coat protein YsxE [Rossellomorea aquimaris]
MALTIEDLRPVLQPYGVEPYFVENIHKVVKVYSNKGTLAVKHIPTQHGVDFVRHVQVLFQKGYNRIVPIYPTLDGRYAVWNNEELFYVMPWLMNEEKEDRFEKHQKLFRELARLHTISSQEVKINKEDRESHYEQLTSRWEKEQQFLEEYVESCEKTTYMSPFQLHFCMYYKDTSQALKFSRKMIDEWYESTKDLEKVRTVITHGKVSIEHFLFDDRGLGYFHNFEESKIASPFHDLLPFLSRTLKTYPKYYEECVEWLTTYFQHFTVRNEERLLFMSYLAYPSSVIAIVEKYFHTPKGKRNERKSLKKLQRHYWLLKNTEYIVMRLDEIEKQKKEQQQEAES